MTGIAKIAVILTGLAAAVAGIPVGAQPDRAQIKADYLATTAQLNQHVLTGGLLDDAAESATLLGRQWAL
ncbi:MAG: hypothetical protein JSS41_00335, partial [Proteobacteria bacterium]|nr:hypothetical protein [Pseudomonadota bacterium]